jgi:hypothetical protein
MREGLLAAAACVTGIVAAEMVIGLIRLIGLALGGTP